MSISPSVSVERGVMATAANISEGIILLLRRSGMLGLSFQNAPHGTENSGRFKQYPNRAQFGTLSCKDDVGHWLMLNIRVGSRRRAIIFAAIQIQRRDNERNVVGRPLYAFVKLLVGTAGSSRANCSGLFCI